MNIKMEKKIINFWISKADKEALADVARNIGLSLSAFLRLIIRKELNNKNEPR